MSKEYSGESRNEDQQYQGVLRHAPTLITGEGLQLQCSGTGSAEWKRAVAPGKAADYKGAWVIGQAGPQKL